MEYKMFDEEELRQAACFGNTDYLKELISRKVNINSKNQVNGWTALHWAASRDNIEAVTILLNNGADPKSLSSSGDSPCDLATSEKVRALLGGKSSPSKKWSLPITPNYLKNPPFFYSMRNSIGKESSINQPEIFSEGVLLLKVRVADAPETDFIEIELQKSELSFDKLKETCCKELDIEPHTVSKIRKLPNTIVRNDKDVQRLTNLQELEVFQTLGNDLQNV